MSLTTDTYLDQLPELKQQVNATLIALPDIDTSTVQRHVTALTELIQNSQVTLDDNMPIDQKLTKMVDIKQQLIKVKQQVLPLFQQLQVIQHDRAQLEKTLRKAIAQGEELAKTEPSETLQGVLVSLLTQLQQVSTMDVAFEQPYQRLQYIVEQFIPITLIELNANNMWLKYALVQELNPDLSKQLTLSQPDTTNSDITNMLNTIKQSTKDLQNKLATEDYIGKHIMLSDTQKIIDQITKLEERVTNHA